MCHLLIARSSSSKVARVVDRSRTFRTRGRRKCSKGFENDGAREGERPFILVGERRVKPDSFSGVSSSARRGKKDVAGRSRRPDVENGTRSAPPRVGKRPTGILFTKSVKSLVGQGLPGRCRSPVQLIEQRVDKSESSTARRQGEKKIAL